jgi:hypothetical protein
MILACQFDGSRGQVEGNNHGECPLGGHGSGYTGALENIQISGATIEGEGCYTSSAFDTDGFRGACNHGSKPDWARCASEWGGCRWADTVDLVGLGGVNSGVAKRRALVLLKTSSRPSQGDWCQNTSSWDGIISHKAVVDVGHPYLSYS